MSTPAPELSPGTALDGYTLGAKVRTRSGAATHLAKDASGKTVHLTVYADTCFPSPLVRERSLRELRQLQAVDAPQLAKVIDCGKFGEAGIYEVGEVVDGQPLSEAGQLSPPEVGATMNAVGEALLAAQKVGVIHRNLGAHVVFATERGIKVVGFTVGEPHGAAFGPIDSIAPEQVGGKVVDQRTLIYNLAAVAHQLLTGRPLFDGTSEQKLDLHLNAEPTGVDAALVRALSKDPRTRPMMLKQFVGDLAKFGGGSTASAAAKPSSRGWTMFMDASPVAGAGPSAPAPSAPAPSAPMVAPAVSAPMSAPVSAPAPSAPMSAPISAPMSAPMSAPVSAPAPSAPAPAASKPSTRGWTMFMDAEPGDAATAAAAPSPTPSPAPTPVAAPAPAPMPVAPAPAPAAAKPSTRGWTMFMDAEPGPDEAASPVSAPSAPAPSAPAPSAPAPSAPMPAPSAPAPSAPMSAPISAPMSAPVSAPISAPVSAPADPSKPSTRGWTMFMDAEPTPSASAAPSGAAPSPSAPSPSPSAPSPSAPSPSAPSPSAPVPAPAGSDAPSMRGWTMFMEADSSRLDTEPIAPTPAPAPAPAPEPAAAPTTRGWTMFMEAQLPGDPPATPAAPEPAPAAAPPGTPAPAGNVGSDAKGWTIFVERPAALREAAAAAAASAAAAPSPSPAASAPREDVAVSGRGMAAEETVRPAAPTDAPPMGAPAPVPYSPAPMGTPAPRPSNLPVRSGKSKTPLIIGGVTLVVILILAFVFWP